MKKIIIIVCAALLFGLFSCGNNGDWKNNERVKFALGKSGGNIEELKRAINEAPKEQKEAVIFLIENMPQIDLQNLSATFILENTTLAYKAKEQFVWCGDLPDSIFLNEVLPYANLDEKRDNWRPDFYSKFSEIVKECSDMRSAIDSVNQNIQKILEVDYNTKRSIVNISPLQAMKEKMATCTGLSFLLVDAFRAVGIPARVAGTPLWTNMRGNHSWVEVWMEGKWYFTEYYPDKLNHSWFLSDAGKADPEKPIHWIYAASYKKADTHFPMVWDSTTTYHAYNVTDRYIKLYQEQLAEKAVGMNEVILNVVIYKDKSPNNEDNRMGTKIEVLQEGKVIDFGFTPNSKDDLNKFLKFKLKKGTTYHFQFSDGQGNMKDLEFISPQESGEVMKLYMNN